MKKLTLTLMGVALALANVNAKLPTYKELADAYVETDGAKSNIIASAAYKNPELYQHLKANNWELEGAKLLPVHIFHAKNFKKDYEAISDVEAATYANLNVYKTIIAAKVAQINETIAAYDFLQRARLAVVESQTPTHYDAKLAFLDDFAQQVLKQAKDKE